MAFLDDTGVEYLAADIKELADNRYVNADGDKMTGSLSMRTSNITEGNPPSSNAYGDESLLIEDSNGASVAQAQAVHTANDELGVYFGANRTVGGSQVDNKVRLMVNSSGERVVTVSDAGAWRDALVINNTVKEVTPSAVNVSSATDTTLCNSGSLSAGTYIIMFRASFASNSSGRRAIFLATSNSGSTYEGANVTTAPANGAATQLEGVKIVTLTSATTFYLRAYHNAGSSLSTTGRMEILKIH